MLKGDCNMCVHRAADPADKMCAECGIARKNYEERTMDEYISRDAAELLMCYACGFDCKRYKRVSGQSLITADDCYHLRDLYAVPAADVAEVRHGHWIRKVDESAREFWCERTQCSICGEEWGGAMPNYCPNCGAKMDESEGEE